MNKIHGPASAHIVQKPPAALRLRPRRHAVGVQGRHAKAWRAGCPWSAKPQKKVNHRGITAPVPQSYSGRKTMGPAVEYLRFGSPECTSPMLPRRKAKGTVPVPVMPQACCARRGQLRRPRIICSEIDGDTEGKRQRAVACANRTEDLRRAPPMIAAVRRPFNAGEDLDTFTMLWARMVGPGSNLGGMEWTLASDGKRIYVAIANNTSYQAGKSGPWSKLDALTGRILWRTPDQIVTIDLVKLAVAGGVVYAPSMGFDERQATMFALNAATGDKLRSFASGASVIAGATIVCGAVYRGSGYANLARPSSAQTSFSCSRSAENKRRKREGETAIVPPLRTNFVHHLNPRRIQNDLEDTYRR